MKSTDLLSALRVFLAYSVLTLSGSVWGFEREPTPDWSQIGCIATAIWHEARNESERGQAAVAWVIMNRVSQGFAHSPCSVVYQTHTVYNSQTKTRQRFCQFEWHCNRRVRPPNTETLEWERVQDIAFRVFVAGEYTGVLPPNTVFFHSRTVNPGWRYTRVAVIGNHVFYSRRPVRG